VNPIYKVPWFRPYPVGEQIPGAEVRIDAIIFQMELANLLNWDYLDYHDRPDRQKFPYRFRCLSCYAASGDNDSFRTQCEQLQRLKDGPTQEQQDQMSDHARQHTIMYSWAKGLK
jgi:hypothetical protein